MKFQYAETRVRARALLRPEIPRRGAFLDSGIIHISMTHLARVSPAHKGNIYVTRQDRGGVLAIP